MRIPQTERLRLRPFTLDDLSHVVAQFEDEYARRFYPIHENPEADAEGWIRWNLRNYENHGFGLWAMELRETGEYVGDCGITMQDVEGSPRHEVGYHVVGRLRRRGLATEAARACRDHALDVLGCGLVVSIVHADNVASRTVAERVHDRIVETTRKGMPHLVYATERPARLTPDATAMTTDP